MISLVLAIEGPRRADRMLCELIQLLDVVICKHLLLVTELKHASLGAPFTYHTGIQHLRLFINLFLFFVRFLAGGSRRRILLNLLVLPLLLLLKHLLLILLGRPIL